MFNKTFGMVAAIIELNDNDNENARFDDFIQVFSFCFSTS